MMFEMAVPLDYSTISEQAQGMAFYNDKLLLSHSFGILPSRIVFYEQSDKRLYVNENSARSYRMPEMIEQIVVEGDELYVLFESGAYAYRGYAGNVVDRVLKLNLIKWKSLIRKSTKIGLSTYIKCKEVRHIEAQQIENLFAGNIRNLLMDAKLDYDKLYEIRLRVGRPLFLTYDGGECFCENRVRNSIW